MRKLSLNRDSGRPPPSSCSTCWKHAVSTGPLILLYFSLSIGLTFYQRWLLQKLRFPLFVTSAHLVFKFLSAAFLRSLYECIYHRRRVTLSWLDYSRKVAPVGLTGGFDVAFSNWGLELITISLYTMTKSTSIIFILIFSLIFKLEKKSWRIIVIVLMMSTGLLLFTYKATQFNLLGFILVFLATFSSGLRWTLAQLLMQKSKLGLENPVDMLYHVQPWMLVMVLPFAIVFEGVTVAGSCKVFNYGDWSDLWRTLWTILLGAFIALCMELTEYLVVSITSSLTLSIVGIFKEVCTLVLAVQVTDDQLSLINVAGLLICLGGITLHVISKAIIASHQPEEDGGEGIILTSRGGPGELRTPLLADESLNSALLSESDSDTSDVLFSVLQRRTNSAYDLEDRSQIPTLLPIKPEEIEMGQRLGCVYRVI